MALRTLAVDFNSYFASCEMQERPELRGKPDGIVPMLAETTGCIAASRQAKAGFEQGYTPWLAQFIARILSRSTRTPVNRSGLSPGSHMQAFPKIRNHRSSRRSPPKGAALAGRQLPLENQL